MTTSESAMQTDRFDRASDWCNPILVKEVRQALKSRPFAATFLMLLLGSWLISAFGLLAAGASVEYGNVGQAFFIFYFGVLCIALGVVVPFSAFRSLLNERDDNTYELLSITTLSPGQIVRGKWACAIVQSLLFYSAIAPFVAFTALLQGFDFAQAAILLVAAFYGSTALSITSLMLSTLVRQRVWQGFLSMALIAGLCVLISMVLSGLSSLMIFPLPLDEPEFWWLLAGVVVMTATYQWLFYQIASARLTFESENRSTGIRWTVCGQFWLLWIIAGIFHWYRGLVPDEELVWFLTAVSGAHLALVGLAFAAEPDGLSRRVRRTLPKSVVMRALLIPFLPGGARGYLFVLLHLPALYLLSTAATVWSGNDILSNSSFVSYSPLPEETSAWQERPTAFVVAIICYIAIYSGLAACFLRWGQRIFPVFSGAHARTMIVIIIALGFLVPMGMRIGRFVPFNGVSLSDVFFPFWLLFDIGANTWSSQQIRIIAAVACVVICLNLPSMYRGIVEILQGPRRSASRPQITPSVVSPLVLDTEVRNTGERDRTPVQ